MTSSSAALPETDNASSRNHGTLYALRENGFITAPDAEPGGIVDVDAIIAGETEFTTFHFEISERLFGVQSVGGGCNRPPLGLRRFYDIDIPQLPVMLVPFRPDSHAGSGIDIHVGQRQVGIAFRQDDAVHVEVMVPHQKKAADPKLIETVTVGIGVDPEDIAGKPFGLRHRIHAGNRRKESPAGVLAADRHGGFVHLVSIDHPKIFSGKIRIADKLEIGIIARGRHCHGFHDAGERIILPVRPVDVEVGESDPFAVGDRDETAPDFVLTEEESRPLPVEFEITEPVEHQEPIRMKPVNAFGNRQFGRSRFQTVCDGAIECAGVVRDIRTGSEIRNRHALRIFWSRGIDFELRASGRDAP